MVAPQAFVGMSKLLLGSINQITQVTYDVSRLVKTDEVAQQTDWRFS